MQSVIVQLQIVKMLVQYYGLYLILNFVGIMFSTNQGKSKSYNVYSHPNIPCTQHLLLLVSYTHQSMPIIMTLSLDLRLAVPTVGSIRLVLLPPNNTSTVMAQNFNWPILTLDQSSTVAVNTMCGVLGVMGNCCSYFPQESP